YYATTIGGTIAFSTTGPDWTGTWNTTTVAPGTYTLTAVATDNGGATGTSAGIPITLVAAANTPPTVSITQPTANATFTVGNAVTLKATATDTNGSVTRVDYYATTITGTIAFSTTGPDWTGTWNTTAVAPGTYTLTAVATDNGGATGTSAGIPITLQAGAAQGLPAPWQTQDVGTVGLAGSATVAAGTYTLKGSGAGISGSSDAFLFAYQSLPGDGQIIARVTGIQSTQDFAKVGVMIREGLTPGARNASLMLTPSGLLYFQYR